MRALVKASGGKLGQNLYQIGPAVASGKFTDKAIVEAAKVLADLGGAEAPLAGAQRGNKEAGEKFGVDDPSIRNMTGKTDGSEVKLNKPSSSRTRNRKSGDLPTSDKDGNPKKRRFEQQESSLSSKIEEAIWQMIKQEKNR